MGVKKHPNSKFSKGSEAYKARQERLALISARLASGKSFVDLQGASTKR